MEKREESTAGAGETEHKTGGSATAKAETGNTEVTSFLDKPTDDEFRVS